jgi:hypothetical protein
VAWWWLAVVPAVAATFLRSGGSERDPKKYGKDLISYMFSGIIGLRDIASAWAYGRTSPVTSPALAFTEDIGRLAKAITSDAPGKGKRIAKYIIKPAGYITGLPSQSAWVAIDGIMDMMEGKTTDPRRLIYSKYALDKKKKKTKKKYRINMGKFGTKRKKYKIKMGI